jgi:hypothetical protein
MIIFSDGPPFSFLRAFVFLEASLLSSPNYDRRRSQSIIRHAEL